MVGAGEWAGRVVGHQAEVHPVGGAERMHQCSQRIQTTTGIEVQHALRDEWKAMSWKKKLILHYLVLLQVKYN